MFQVPVHARIVRDVPLQRDVSIDGKEGVLEIVESNRVEEVEFLVCLLAVPAPPAFGP